MHLFWLFSFKWKSSNLDIVSVNSKGEVTARKGGKATISVTCALSKKMTKCLVIVTGQSGENVDNENIMIIAV